MELEHVITGLLRKRQAIADELEAAQGTVRKLIQDIDAVDATIKLFQPDAPIGIVRIRPTPRRHAAFRGESSRLILNMLREADGPMTTRDIVLKVMGARGLSAADRVMHETMRLRVSSSLRGLRNGQSVCPHCGSLTCYEARRPNGSLRFRCKDCGKDFTLTSGTLFAFHKLPLRIYLAMVLSFCNEVKGKSAAALRREFRTQYKTAFVLAHKLREAMATDAPNGRVGGEGKVVENDGAYFGGKIRQENLASDRIDRRFTENKNGKQQCVVVVRERGGRTVPKVFQSERESADFIASFVQPGSTLMTDAAKAWNVLKKRFPVRQISHTSAFSLNGASTNLAESFFSRMRRAEWAIITASRAPIWSDTPSRAHGGRTIAGSTMGHRFERSSDWPWRLSQAESLRVTGSGQRGSDCTRRLTKRLPAHLLDVMV